MTAKEAIKQISVMLGVAQAGETTETIVEVQLAEYELVDGTKVRCEGDSLEVGKQLFVITDEGDVRAPEGKHQTKDGIVISVDAEGVITGLDEVEEEEASADEVEAELEATEETTITLSEEVVGKVMEALTTISADIEALKGRVDATDEAFHSFKNEPASGKITNNLNLSQKTQGELEDARWQKIVEYRNQTSNK
jgi:hypothetical protein